MWDDGYYLTANKFVGNTTYVLEKEGLFDPDDLNPVIIGFDLPDAFNNPNTVFSPEPANLIGTSFPVAGAPGYIVYLQDDGWSGAITFDHLKVWEIEADFDMPSASTISSPITIPTAAFDSVFFPFGTGDVNQPGTSNRIDAIGGVISYAANYRTFADHNSWLITFNVDVDGSNTSGIRWIELRNTDTEDWTIFQEGTYAPDDGNSRFMGSGAIDAAGNIGLAFNIGGPTLRAGIRYTGRFAGDELGMMTVEETSIIEGNGVQTTTNRFGDYSHLTMDPDNFTFWHTAEYFPSNNFWTTRIASFSLSGGFNDDVGVSAIINPQDGVLGSSETVEIEIRNFGLNAQNNIPLELRVDDVLVASENFTGTIMPNEVANYTFTQTVDLSIGGTAYEISARTVLPGDEFEINDEVVSQVLNLFANDLGVTGIVSPVSGAALGDEQVTVTIQNFGGDPQSDFEVSYAIDGDSPITETVSGSLAPGETLDYTFNQLADLSLPGSYVIEATTLLDSDDDESNDAIETTVINLECLPSTNDTNFPVGPNAGTVTESTIAVASSTIVNDVNVTVNINHTWDGDIAISLIAPDGTTVDLSSGNGGSGDNYTNTVFDDAADMDITNGNAPFTGVFRPEGNLSDFNGLVATGDWTLEIVDNANADGGTLLDWTLEICGDGVLSVGDTLAPDDAFSVFDRGDNQFQVNLQTSAITDRLTLDVFNILGQNIEKRRLSYENGGYNYLLNLSHLSSGVYIVRLGNNSVGRVQKIIVR